MFMRFVQRFLRVLLPLIVLAAGFALLRYLVLTKPSAPRRPPVEHAELVEVMPLSKSTSPIEVQATGVVTPAQVLSVQAEVGGRVVELSENLVPGGRVQAGEVLLQIDRRDYDLAVQQQRANVVRARVDLEMETGRRAVAEREWALLDGEIETTPEGRALALRKPQALNARATLAAAESVLAQAELLATRTTIKAPFNAVVDEGHVEVGQLVNPQSRIATLVGTDHFWVRVAVPLADLGWVATPELGGSIGALARVRFEVAPGRVVLREGRVVRLLPSLEPAGRMAQILVEVEHPLRGLIGDEMAQDNGPSPLPLLLGAYVEVSLFGPTLEDVFEVPRLALRDGDRIWVMGPDDRLDIRPVGVVWRGPKSVWVGDGLAEGERLVTSRLVAPVPGMALRVRESQHEGEGRP